MFRLLRAFFRPMKVIAEELKIIRQLYELDLASRERPIFRQTETPTKGDTTVTYAGVEDRTPRYKQWLGLDEGFDENE